MFSSPVEIAEVQLECYLFGNAEEVIGNDGAPAEVLRRRADAVRELLQTSAEAVAVLEREGWEAWACDNAIYLSHPDIRFGSEDQMWEYLEQVGADFVEVVLYPYPEHDPVPLKERVLP